jgi:hypothetical protein
VIAAQTIENPTLPRRGSAPAAEHLGTAFIVKTFWGKWIRTHLQSTATLFGVRMNYFSIVDGMVKCKAFTPEAA